VIIVVHVPSADSAVRQEEVDIGIKIRDHWIEPTTWRGTGRGFVGERTFEDQPRPDDRVGLQRGIAGPRLLCGTYDGVTCEQRECDQQPCAPSSQQFNP